ncbi:MAG: hypothetical protein AAGK14_02685 [Verrucomicrobiota bacterium]
MKTAVPQQPIRAENLPAEKPARRKPKRSAVGSQVIRPDAEGWTLLAAPGQPESEARHAPDLEGLVSSLNPRGEVTLLLPLNAVLLQHLRLPSADPEEIHSMAALQVEKAGIIEDATAFSCQILEQREDASSVLCLMLREDKVEQLCAPLLEAGIFPQRAYLHLDSFAGSLPAGQIQLVLLREGPDLVLGLINRNRLVFAEILDVAPGATLDGDAINQALWRAELSGLSTSFDQIVVGRGCEAWRQALADYFQAPVVELPGELPAKPTATELTPASWKNRQAARQRRRQTMRWLWLGGVVYALLLVAALAWILYRQTQLQSLEAANERLQQQLVQQAEYTARWEAWQGSVDPEATPLEYLVAACDALPDPEVKLVNFHYKPDEITIEGEAPTLPEANEAVRNIKKTFAEMGFDVGSDLPTPLKDDRYHFNIRVFKFAAGPPSS